MISLVGNTILAPPFSFQLLILAGIGPYTVDATSHLAAGSMKNDVFGAGRIVDDRSTIGAVAADTDLI